MRSRRPIEYLLTLALGATVACAASEEGEPELATEAGGRGPSGETIIRWNSNTFTVLTTLDSGAPAGLLLIRELPMVHIAMHDAANAVDDQFETYVLDVEDGGADAALAAAAAAHETLALLRPGKRAQIDAFLQVDLARVSNANKQNRSLALGAAAANAIVALRSDDGFFDAVPYTFGPPDPGVYQPVPPAGTSVAGTQLPFVTPFGLDSGGQFRAPPPPALSSAEWLAEYNETKDFGRSDSAVRTQDQTQSARFWREQTQFAWNNIARGVAASRDKGLWQTARVFALLNMGLMDALIANFESKYFYNRWRPFTAIREIDDGRADTVMDPTWQPLNPTPGHPELNSAQGVLGAAAAYPLTRVYGSNVRFTITTSTADPAGSTRTFQSFDHAVAESADSRIWGGIHFRSSTGAPAQAQGTSVGRFLHDHFLRRD